MNELRAAAGISSHVEKVEFAGFGLAVAMPDDNPESFSHPDGCAKIKV
jgi:hypothetical protein